MPGRVEQMAAMRSLIERADAGPRTVVVVGGPGSGKSTVLMAVEELAVARGHRSLRCIGLPGASYADGAGLHQLIHAERDRIDRLEPRLAAALLSVFGETPVPADRQLVLLATVRLLQLVASDRPLLVAVDDLQWLDDLSRDCLLSLPAQLGSASVLLVMTVRPGPTEQQLPSNPATTRFDLTPLSRSEADDLMAGLGLQLDDRLREQILARAAGNPLVLTELTRVAGTSQAAAGPVERWPVTRRMRSRILADVARLPAGARRLLLAAAAAEGDSTVTLADAAARLAITDDDRRAVERTGLLDATEARVHVRDPLVRDTLYASALWSDRVEVLRALAAAAGSAQAQRYDVALAAELTIGTTGS